MSADAVVRSVADRVRRLGPLDETAMAAARARLDGLAKPPGSLGRLEALAITLAGITGQRAPRFDRRTIVVAAADHGVTTRGVSPYPSSVTAAMVGTFLTGRAAINVLARTVRADVLVVDAGVASPMRLPPNGPASGVRFLRRPIRLGTADLTAGPALSRDDALAAIGAGVEIAIDEGRRGVALIALGEMGIGNTTAASALAAALTGVAADAVVGPGSGLDEEGRRRKAALVEAALALHRPDASDPIGALAALGGLEIGVLAGVALGAAAERLPVLVDGFIAGVAALVAAAVCPGMSARFVAAHRSAEPGHAVVLRALDLEPLLDLELRLGEGTGAALALPLVDAACRLRDETATLDEVLGLVVT